MNALKFFAVFLLAIVALEGALASALNNPTRSERWDAYIQSLKDSHEARRSRRQTGAREWESNPANCNPTLYTVNDSMGRRQGGLLAEPQNQGRCGSCWAFASVNTLTDQLSITQGSRHPLLSAGYLTSCLKDRSLVTNGNGCCGAALHAGPKFFRETGLVTATCSPYSANTLKRNLPSCPRRCSNGSPFSLSSYGSMGYRRLNSDQEILAALQAGAVVLVAMEVTQEFGTYQCGVYQDSGATDIRGLHAVEIVDFGTTASGTNFWVVKNSWGNQHGENGYFRIKRGHLKIGFMAFRLVAGSNTQDTTTLKTCDLLTVSNPTSDEMVMSAVEFVQEQLITMNLVTCTDGTRGTAFSDITSMSVQTQIVSGTRVDIEMTADVTGCSKSTKADITASVFIDLDGNFSLNTQNVSTRSSAKDLASLWWPLLLLTAILSITFAQM